MAYYSDSDILMVGSQGDILLSLNCGYGQPVKTTVYLKKLDGSSDKLTEFSDNTDNYNLGNSDSLKGQVIEIHSTIHDIRDTIPGQEVEDIELKIKVWCNADSVDTEFLKRTKGKGQLVVCKYEVNIF
jgi:hypothetical protein